MGSFLSVGEVMALILAALQAVMYQCRAAGQLVNSLCVCVNSASSFGKLQTGQAKERRSRPIGEAIVPLHSAGHGGPVLGAHLRTVHTVIN